MLHCLYKQDWFYCNLRVWFVSYGNTVHDSSIQTQQLGNDIQRVTSCLMCDSRHIFAFLLTMFSFTVTDALTSICLHLDYLPSLFKMNVFGH